MCFSCLVQQFCVLMPTWVCSNASMGVFAQHCLQNTVLYFKMDAN